MPKPILFNAFYMGSPSQAWAGLWAHPKAQTDRYCDLAFWQDLARTAERGLIDGIFFADQLGVMDAYEGRPDALIRSGGMCPINDPMMVIPAMAAVTENLCFGVTGNTTYEQPYLLARRLSTLDHLTKGRIAWNIVTGIAPAAAMAMGQKPVAHDKRYDIADEYMDLMYKLWEGSWEDDAVLRDKANQIYADPAKVHMIKHHGEYLSSEAMFICEPSPQRTPFLFAAGSSGRGSAFAGKHGEAAFMSASDMGYSKRVVDGYRNAAIENGRAPDDIKVINAATIIVAPTEAEARALQEEYQQYASFEGNLAMLSGWTGIDFSKYGPDEPIEHAEGNAIQSILDSMTKHNTGEKVTPRALARFARTPGREAFIIGSPSQVCDTIIEWVEKVGVDGFNLHRTVEPGGLGAFVDLVVPELRDRGYYKTEYDAGTMREKMQPGRGPKLASDHYGARFKFGASAPHDEEIVASLI
ncbi:MAG TPA: LLM class flavin-dependent oxidoreductase [Sphingobium sp.]